MKPSTYNFGQIHSFFGNLVYCQNVFGLVDNEKTQLIELLEKHLTSFTNGYHTQVNTGGQSKRSLSNGTIINSFEFLNLKKNLHENIFS